MKMNVYSAVYNDTNPGAGTEPLNAAAAENQTYALSSAKKADLIKKPPRF